MTLATSTQSTPIVTNGKRRPSRLERAEVSRLLNLALRLRAESLKRGGNPGLIQHGDWHIDRALFARRAMRERGVPELIGRIKRDLCASFNAYRHAIYGIFIPADNQLTSLLDRGKMHRNRANARRKSAKGEGGENLCSFSPSPPITQPLTRDREIKKFVLLEKLGGACGPSCKTDRLESDPGQPW